jgi:hypothetical protein
VDVLYVPGKQYVQVALDTAFIWDLMFVICKNNSNNIMNNLPML